MPLIVLDRDGVINIDRTDYVRSQEDWEAIPGSLEAIARLTDAGWKVVVATNQAAIARRMIDYSTLGEIHHEMCKQVRAAGGEIDKIFFCPHHPDDDCDCRKPKAGLLHHIATHYGLTCWEGVPLIGDSLRDLQAAEAVGASPILVLTGHGEKTREQLSKAIPIFKNLWDAVAHVLPH